jgi:hypothetical protein
LNDQIDEINAREPEPRKYSRMQRT